MSAQTIDIPYCKFIKMSFCETGIRSGLICGVLNAGVGTRHQICILISRCNPDGSQFLPVVVETLYRILVNEPLRPYERLVSGERHYRRDKSMISHEVVPAIVTPEMGIAKVSASQSPEQFLRGCRGIGRLRFSPPRND
jgi:hypothetical protein